LISPLRRVLGKVGTPECFIAGTLVAVPSTNSFAAVYVIDDSEQANLNEFLIAAGLFSTAAGLAIYDRKSRRATRKKSSQSSMDGFDLALDELKRLQQLGNIWIGESKRLWLPSSNDLVIPSSKIELPKLILPTE